MATIDLNATCSSTTDSPEVNLSLYYSLMFGSCKSLGSGGPTTLRLSPSLSSEALSVSSSEGILSNGILYISGSSNSVPTAANSGLGIRGPFSFTAKMSSSVTGFWSGIVPFTEVSAEFKEYWDPINYEFIVPESVLGSLYRIDFKVVYDSTWLARETVGLWIVCFSINNPWDQNYFIPADINPSAGVEFLYQTIVKVEAIAGTRMGFYTGHSSGTFKTISPASEVKITLIQ